MKQKINNRVLSVLNVLGWGMYLLIEYFGKNCQSMVNIDWTVLAIFGQEREVVTLSNILFIVLLSINIYFLIQNRKNRKIVPWYIVASIFYFIATLSIFLVNVFERVSRLWAIVPIIIFAIFLIIELVRTKRKKVIIISSVAIVISIVMAIVNMYNDVIWLIVASIMQFIYSKENEEESKSQKFMNTIILGIVVIMLVYGVIKYVMLIQDLHAVDEESIEFFNTIQTAVQNENINNKMIRVSRNGKWGYINQDGKEVISCEYDYISNNATTHAYVLAKKDNTYYIISKNGTTIVTSQGTPAPFYKGEILRLQLSSVAPENMDNMLALVIDRISAYVKEERVANKEVATNILEPRKYGEKTYEYGLEDGNVAEVNEVEKNGEKVYNVTIKAGEEVVNTYENINLLMDSRTKGTLQTFTNGDVPYYNLKRKVQGYYTKNNFNEVNLNGKFQILDTIEDKIIVRNYSDVKNIKEIILNTNGEILLIANSINVTENGYIIKKENDKVVYLDNDLNERTQEFDFISAYYISEGKLICGNNSDGYVLCDLEGNIVTTQKYEVMNMETSFEDGSTREYLLDSVYKEYYKNPAQ